MQQRGKLKGLVHSRPDLFGWQVVRDAGQSVVHVRVKTVDNPELSQPQARGGRELARGGCDCGNAVVGERGVSASTKRRKVMLECSHDQLRAAEALLQAPILKSPLQTCLSAVHLPGRSRFSAET